MKTDIVLYNTEEESVKKEKRRFKILIAVAFFFVLASFVTLIIRIIIRNNAINAEPPKISVEDPDNSDVIHVIENDDFEIPKFEQINTTWSCGNGASIIQITNERLYRNLTTGAQSSYSYDAENGILSINPPISTEYYLTIDGSLLRMTDSTTDAVIECERRENYEK